MRAVPSGLHLLALVMLVSVACAACGVDTERASAEFAPLATLAPVAAAPTTSTTAAAPSSTTTTTEVPPATEPPRPALVVHGTGDVNLDPGFVRSFRTEGYELAWSGLDGLFADDGVTVVNLECSAGPGGSAWDKTWTFQCDPEAYPVAAAAGVDVASQANNHGADFGFDAMLAGRDLLSAAGIAPVGAGPDRDEAYAPAFLQVDGWTVAVIGLSAVGPENGSWTAGPSTPGVASATDLERATAAIGAAKAAADVVIVTVHWGEELDVEPRPWVRRLGEAYIDAGADGVFGHHTHRVGPLSWYRDRPIAWSLGNFVWQAHPPEATSTAIARFVFEPDGRIGACLIPVVIERTGHPVVQGEPPEGCAVDGD